MPKIELSRVETLLVTTLFKQRIRIHAEANKELNEGLKELLEAHEYSWSGSEINLRDKNGKTYLEWDDPKNEKTND